MPAGAGDYLKKLLGFGPPEPPPQPPPPVDPTAGMTVEQKIRYASPEARRARAAEAAASAAAAQKAAEIKALNPVEPSQNWFTKLIFGGGQQ